MDALELHAAIHCGEPPAILDVRNEDEFKRWKVEGRTPLQILNLPYFGFIDDETGSVAKARAWKAAIPGNLVVVCAKGDSSAYVAEALRASGIPASNLDRGMLGWGEATSVRSLAPRAPLRAWQFNRFGKGCLSYVVAAGRDALVVDPHRRIEVYRKSIADFGLRLRGVFDTHLHADHLSGARALASAEGVPYYASPVDFEEAAFGFTPADDRTPLLLGPRGGIQVRFVKAPGHTPGTTLLSVEELLLTGDTLFVGSIGRPDLGGHAREWAADLHETLIRRLGKFEGDVRVLPAHSHGPSELGPDGTVSETLERLRQRLPLLRLDRTPFIDAVLGGLTPAPPGYERIRRLNLGLETAGEDEAAELETGKNECALSRKG